MNLGHETARAQPAEDEHVASDAVDAELLTSGAPPVRVGSLVAAGACLLVLVLYLPPLAGSEVTARVLVVGPVGAWGIVALVRLALKRDRPAQFATVFLAWALFCVVMSVQPVLSLYSGFATDRGWLFLTAFIGFWAVGRSATTEARRWIEIALLFGLTLNALLALAQAGWDGQELLSLSESRGIGFAPSSVYLGGWMAGGVALAVARLAASRQRWWVWLAPIAAFVSGAQLSGSRIGLLAAALVGLAAVRRSGWIKMAAVVGALVVGLGIAALASAGSDIASSTDRVAASDGGGGVHPRLSMWSAGGEALLERPIFGWGPGQFRTATTPRITASFARDQGPGRVFFDAHNLLVEHAVTVGIPGVLLLAGFGWTVARRARGPLAWFALGVVVTWLLEPVSIATGPLVLLVLGVSDSRPSLGPPASASGRVVNGIAIAVLVVFGAFGAARLALAAIEVKKAETEFSLDAIHHAQALFPRDPALSDTESQILLKFMEISPTEHLARQLRVSASHTVDLDDQQSLWWNRLAIAEYSYGSVFDEDRNAATAYALQRAYDRNPWSLMTLQNSHALAIESDNEGEAAKWVDRLCSIDSCPAR